MAKRKSKRKPSQKLTDALDYLVNARGLLAQRGRWFQGALAVRVTDDDQLIEVEPTSGLALAMCPQGALQWASGYPSRKYVETYGFYNPALAYAHGLLHDYALSKGYKLLCQFNDDPKTTHADIMKMFDTAIDNLEREMK